MIAAAVKKHFAGWREWELNPIVIKELRQGVRSWAITGMLLLFLTVLFITSLTFLVTDSFDANANASMGAEMFGAFVAILAGASVFFIPLYVGVRVGLERQENNPDLLYVSTLSPARIVRGKFLGGAYMALLFFSACMPFMAFSNLLRGIDLPTVFCILVFLFMVVCVANMIAIFLACLPASRPFKFLLIIYGFFQSFALVVPLAEFCFRFMRSGIGATMSRGEFWLSTLNFILVVIAGAGLFYFMAVALISPPSANRALPLRVYLSVVWIVGGVVCLSWSYRTGSIDPMWAWIMPTVVIMLCSLLVVVSNSDQISRRVRRTIPESGLKRALAFLFYNGAAGGLVWAGSIIVLTYIAGRAVFADHRVARPADFGLDWYAPVMAYAFDYALTALFLQRTFFRKRPAKLTGLFTVLLAGALAIAPSIVLFFLNRLTWKTIDGLQLGNVFNVLSNREGVDYLSHTLFAFGWLAVAVAINVRWFLRRARDFRPPPAEAPPILE